MRIASEFAQVRLELDWSANGPRLMIEDVRTGVANYLDPLELERLAWARHEHLTALFDSQSLANREQDDSDDRARMTAGNVLRDLGMKQ